MACFEKQSPSSVLSPLLGTDTDSFCSSPEESNAGAVDVSVAWAGPSPKRALSSTSISSTSIEDMSATRASKRRRKSRAKPKAPITQLSASKLDFRDIVHQFTGSPSSSRTTSTFNQRCSSHPHMPRTAQNNVVVFSSHHMPSALAHTSLSREDALLAGALLAESLRTLETISSFFLQPNFNSSATQDTANTRTATSSSCNGKHVDNACRSVAELENFLLKGETKLDTFFPLSSALLNQIAGQCGASSHK